MTAPARPIPIPAMATFPTICVVSLIVLFILSIPASRPVLRLFAGARFCLRLVVVIFKPYCRILPIGKVSL